MIKQNKKTVKTLILLSALYGLQITNAQESNVASGGNATGANGIVSYSIGQMNYSNATGTSGSVNQGTQQPYDIVTLGNDDFPDIKLVLTIYPNPTTAFVNLKIENHSLKDLNYQLFDLNGRQMQSQKITTPETQISMENLTTVIYLLNVFEENKLLKTFKIIKNL